MFESLDRAATLINPQLSADFLHRTACGTTSKMMLGCIGTPLDVGRIECAFRGVVASSNVPFA